MFLQEKEVTSVEKRNGEPVQQIFSTHMHQWSVINGRKYRCECGAYGVKPSGEDAICEVGDYLRGSYQVRQDMSGVPSGYSIYTDKLVSTGNIPWCLASFQPYQRAQELVERWNSGEEEPDFALAFLAHQ